MAFHGFQPNFKQVDIDVSTGEGESPASGSLQFHNTSGFIQYRNGAWESFISGDYVISTKSDTATGSSTQISNVGGDGFPSATTEPTLDSTLQYRSNADKWVYMTKTGGYFNLVDNGSRYAFDTIAGEAGHTFGQAAQNFDDFNVSIISGATTGQFIKSDGDETYSVASGTLADNIAGDIGDLDDVNVAGIASGQWIESNGTTFIIRTAITLASLNAELEDLTDVDSTTNSPQSTANLGFISVGDGTYSFAAMDLSTNVGGDLGELDNVTAEATTSGQVLMADGSNFIMKAITLGDEVTGQLEDLSDVDSTTNSPQSTADLALVSVGDGTYSFKDIVSARRSISSISASTTGVVHTVYIVDTSGGAATFTAPAAHAAGDEIVIKCAGSSQTNAITIATADADTIDGAASKTLESNWGSIRIESDGTNWHRA